MATEGLRVLCQVDAGLTRRIEVLNATCQTNKKMLLQATIDAQATKQSLVNAISPSHTRQFSHDTPTSHTPLARQKRGLFTTIGLATASFLISILSYLQVQASTSIPELPYMSHASPSDTALEALKIATVKNDKTLFSNQQFLRTSQSYYSRLDALAVQLQTIMNIHLQATSQLRDNLIVFGQDLSLISNGLVTTDFISQTEINKIQATSRLGHGESLSTQLQDYVVKPTIINNTLAVILYIPTVNPLRQATLFRPVPFPLFKDNVRYITHCPQDIFAAYSNDLSFSILNQIEATTCLSPHSMCIIHSPRYDHDTDTCLASSFYNRATDIEANLLPDSSNSPFLFSIQDKIFYSVPHKITANFECPNTALAGADGLLTLEGRGHIHNPKQCTIRLGKLLFSPTHRFFGNSTYRSVQFNSSFSHKIFDDFPNNEHGLEMPFDMILPFYNKHNGPNYFFIILWPLLFLTLAAILFYYLPTTLFGRLVLTINTCCARGLAALCPTMNPPRANIRRPRPDLSPSTPPPKGDSLHRVAGAFQRSNRSPDIREDFALPSLGSPPLLLPRTQSCSARTDARANPYAAAGTSDKATPPTIRRIRSNLAELLPLPSSSAPGFRPFLPVATHGLPNPELQRQQFLLTQLHGSNLAAAHVIGDAATSVSSTVRTRPAVHSTDRSIPIYAVPKTTSAHVTTTKPATSLATNPGCTDVADRPHTRRQRSPELNLQDRPRESSSPPSRPVSYTPFSRPPSPDLDHQ